METLDIITPTYEDVEKCTKSEKGQKLMHDLAVETGSLDPPHRGVPWVLLNNVITIYDS